jgi:hypothetical protein
MPDDATVGLTTVAADELATVNGQTQNEPLPKAQRVKPGFGGDGVFQDVDSAHPLPVTDADVASTLAAVLTELQGKLEAGQAVALDAASLAALESITATISGPVEVDNASGGPLGVKQTGVAPPLGYQQITALTASQALPTIPSGAVTAIVTPRAPVRWRDDGTAPTASTGMYLAADQPLTYQGNLGALRLIAVTGSVEVNIAYYGAEA